MTEYSVEDSRMLLTNSTACCAVARIELSKSAGFIATSCQKVTRKWRNLPWRNLPMKIAGFY
jgi:hypothetical protein